jgi:hypothetical protein
MPILKRSKTLTGMREGVLFNPQIMLAAAKPCMASDVTFAALLKKEGAL